MRYRGRAGFQHSERDRTGVLLANLGTPAEPSAAAVRAWLRRFLGDPRVVEAPRPIWWLVLNCLILPLRPRRSAAAYRKIWSASGSPLLTHTLAQARALRERLGERCLVEFGFSYGEPSIAGGIGRLLEGGARRLLVLPLFPQYSATTGGSVFDSVARELGSRRWLPELRLVTHYHDHPAYIQALADSVREFQARHGAPERLLMSFHGAPRFQLERGDPYFCECHKTARLLAAALGLGAADYQVSFQSRFGAARWLEPYTDETLLDMGRRGVGKLQVVCPGFSVDCLETLEEIAMAGAARFRAAGGGELQYIPCLNSRPAHMAFLARLVEEQTQGWPASRIDTALARERARARGRE